MKKNIIITAVVILVLGLVIWKLTSNKKAINAQSQAIDTAAIAIPIKTDTIRSQAVDLSISKTGTVTPFKESKVFATGSANITKVNFNLGDKVTKGQILAVLDNRTNALELQKAQANADKLKNDLQTYQELLAGKATTAQKVKDLQQNYNDALNQVSQLQKQTSDAYIKAPISGVITTKDVESGVFTSPGAQIATIVDLTQSKVQVNMAEDEVYQIKQGQPVNIVADVYADHPFTGSVTFISPQADATHNYMVEMTLKNSGDNLLRSGTFVTADFPAKITHQVLVLPTQAITGSGDDASVYMVQNNHVYQRKIKTGRSLQNSMEVTSGLQQGDVVVVSGQINLKDGSLISVSTLR